MPDESQKIQRVSSCTYQTAPFKLLRPSGGTRKKRIHGGSEKTGEERMLSLQTGRPRATGQAHHSVWPCRTMNTFGRGFDGILIFLQKALWAVVRRTRR